MDWLRTMIKEYRRQKLQNDDKNEEERKKVIRLGKNTGQEMVNDKLSMHDTYKTLKVLQTESMTRWNYFKIQRV